MPDTITVDMNQFDLLPKNPNLTPALEFTRRLQIRTQEWAAADRAHEKLLTANAAALREEGELIRKVADATAQDQQALLAYYSGAGAEFPVLAIGPAADRLGRIGRFRRDLVEQLLPQAGWAAMHAQAEMLDQRARFVTEYVRLRGLWASNVLLAPVFAFEGTASIEHKVDGVWTTKSSIWHKLAQQMYEMARLIGKAAGELQTAAWRGEAARDGYNRQLHQEFDAHFAAVLDGEVR